MSCNGDEKELSLLCSDSKTIKHNDFKINFCLPEYLNLDSIPKGYQDGRWMTTYDYSFPHQPTRTPIWKGTSDSLYINFRITIHEEENLFVFSEYKGDFLNDQMIAKKRAEAPIVVIDSFIETKYNFHIFTLESFFWKNRNYNFERVYLIDNSKYFISFLFEVRNNPDDEEKYRAEALKLMNSIKIVENPTLM